MEADRQEEVSDALVIARWRDPVIFRALDERSAKTVADTYAESARWIAESERILIERGHGDAYGEALGCALLAKHDPWPRCFEDIAQLATAPLGARVRAMAAVIRGLPEIGRR